MQEIFRNQQSPRKAHIQIHEAFLLFAREPLPLSPKHQWAPSASAATPQRPWRSQRRFLGEAGGGRRESPDCELKQVVGGPNSMGWDHVELAFGGAKAFTSTHCTLRGFGA